MKIKLTMRRFAFQTQPGKREFSWKGICLTSVFLICLLFLCLLLFTQNSDNETRIFCQSTKFGLSTRNIESKKTCWAILQHISMFSAFVTYFFYCCKNNKISTWRFIPWPGSPFGLKCQTRT